MLVKELIAELQKHDPELPVKIHPDPELSIDEDLMAYGDVGRIEDNTVYLNRNDIYVDEDDYIEDLENDYDPEIDEEPTVEQYIEECKKTADKIHAVFIKAVV